MYSAHCSCAECDVLSVMCDLCAGAAERGGGGRVWLVDECRGEALWLLVRV